MSILNNAFLSVGIIGLLSMSGGCVPKAPPVNPLAEELARTRELEQLSRETAISTMTERNACMEKSEALQAQVEELMETARKNALNSTQPNVVEISGKHINAINDCVGQFQTAARRSVVVSVNTSTGAVTCSIAMH